MRILSLLGYVLGAKSKRTYPGLGVDRGVQLQVAGGFSHGKNVVLSRFSRVVVGPGSHVVLDDDVYVGGFAELGPTGIIHIGHRTSLQERTVILGEVWFGSYCVVAPNVFVSSGRHHFSDVPYLLIRDQDASAAGIFPQNRVVVGDDCWLGINVVIMPGVTVGRGAIVGANSVVTKDVGPYEIVAGSPARTIGRRLSFVPPAAVDWESEHCLPYFYAGFRQAIDERLADRPLGGLLAPAQFALWLAQGETLSLEARAVSGQTDVWVESVRYRLDEKFRVVDFPAKSWPCVVNSEGAGTLVARAWSR